MTDRRGQRYPCPSCSSSNTDVVASRVASNGSRRVRHRCLSCRHRWTVYKGEPPVRQPRHHLLPEQVREILLSTDSYSALAKRFNRSRPAIANLCTGRSYADLWPELPRRSLSRSCHDCQQWSRGRCGLGFPDPEQEGPGFATDCESFSDGA